MSDPASRLMTVLFEERNKAILSTVGLSMLATGAGLWLLKREKRKQGHQLCIEGDMQWRQVAPFSAALAEAKGFGETGLQAQLVAERPSPDVMKERAEAFFNLMSTRRTVRFYSTDDVPPGVVETCIATAGTSPSGAHHQPWFFAIVRNATLKQQIRELVEEEEKINYGRRMRKTWIDDLSSMTAAGADKRLLSDDGASPVKPYLTEAPIVLALFKQSHGFDAVGNKVDNYYVNESCCIAAGLLIAALHNAGLATLTSTPMGAEQKIREMLGRPSNEKLLLLMPIGYPAADATVPYRVPVRNPRSLLYTTVEADQRVQQPTAAACA